MNFPHYTIMDLAAGEYDLICTRKFIFLVHITSCSQAEKFTTALLYNQFYSDKLSICLFICSLINYFDQLL